uniref:NAD-dependent epimerase/dehydratase domain-containing protein n=1 Tax=Setaria digitata TaxID=48799 RepID=A0A915Q635_9BILA
MDRIRRYNGLSRMKYLLKTINESKFINASNRKLVAVVTGASGTIGTEIVRLLLQNKFKVICLVQDRDNDHRLGSFKCQPNFVMQNVDLANLEEVKETAKLLAYEYSSVDLIICGAGIMLQPYKLTKGGFEIHCAVNLLSHAVMVNYLMPCIAENSSLESYARNSRIVFLSSAIAHLGVFRGMLEDNFEMFYTYRNGYQAYSASKFAVSLYAEELDKQIQQKSTAMNQRTVTIISMHPGCVAGGLYHYANTLTKFIISQFLWPIMRNPALAAAETIALGCADNLKGGCYYQHMVPTRILCSTMKKEQLYQHVRNIITNMEEL